MIGAIEEAMIARLKSASDLGVLGYRLKAVSSYGGEFDSQDGLATVAKTLPGIWVVYLGERRDEEMGAGRWKMRASFGVLVATSNKRNEASRRHGAGDAVGSYQIAEDVATLLTDQTLGLDIGYLQPRGVKPFPLAKVGNLPISILTVEFETTYTRQAAPNFDAAVLPASVAPPPPDGGQPGDGDGATGLLGLLGLLNQAAGITDFDLIHVDWDVPCPLSDDITLETSS